MNKKFPMENPNIPFSEYLQYLIGQHKKLATEEAQVMNEAEVPYPTSEFTEKLSR